MVIEMPGSGRLIYVLFKAFGLIPSVIVGGLDLNPIPYRTLLVSLHYTVRA